MRKLLAVLFFLTVLCASAYAFTFNIGAYDRDDPIPRPDINADIYYNGVPQGVQTPYIFGSPGNIPFLPGVYSCEKTNYVNWVPEYITIVAVITNISFNFSAVYEEPPTPVELTSFTAVLSQQNLVSLTWVSQSESAMQGYRVYRNESDSQTDAILITPTVISATNTSTTQTYAYTDTEVDAGNTYYYWLESVSLSGSSEFYGPIAILVSGGPGDPGIPPLPTETELLSAFPNPFNPSTTLQYTIKEPSEVGIAIFNTKGQLIRQYSCTHSQPGHYNLVWDGRDSIGRDAASGLYLYRMTAGTFSATKKMLLAK